jgi:peptidoglycan hydrolase-like protein with peptidoglycan-binding domain
MTAKQKQCLLAYLGYYVGDIDGDFGSLSKEATKAFQKDYGFKKEEQDGICGTQTEKALKHAVAYGMPAKKVETDTNVGCKTGTFWDEIKHFTRDEFRCPCGKCGGYPVEPKEALVRIMDEMREAFGMAIIIVPPDGHSGGSGVRCQKYNDSLKGSSPTSRHVQGKACDFSAPGVSAAKIESYLNKLLNAGKIRYWYKISTGSYHLDIN